MNQNKNTQNLDSGGHQRVDQLARRFLFPFALICVFFVLADDSFTFVARRLLALFARPVALALVLPALEIVRFFEGLRRTITSSSSDDEDSDSDSVSDSDSDACELLSSSSSSSSELSSSGCTGGAARLSLVGGWREVAVPFSSLDPDAAVVPLEAAAAVCQKKRKQYAMSNKRKKDTTTQTNRADCEKMTQLHKPTKQTEKIHMMKQTSVARRTQISGFVLILLLVCEEVLLLHGRATTWRVSPSHDLRGVARQSLFRSFHTADTGIMRACTACLLSDVRQAFRDVG